MPDASCHTMRRPFPTRTTSKPRSHVESSSVALYVSVRISNSNPCTLQHQPDASSRRAQPYCRRKKLFAARHDDDTRVTKLPHFGCCDFPTPDHTRWTLPRKIPGNCSARNITFSYIKFDVLKSANFRYRHLNQVQLYTPYDHMLAR